MAGRKRAIMDALAALSSDEGEGESDTNDGSGGEERAPTAAKQGGTKHLKIDDLVRAGYKSGPSVMLVPEPVADRDAHNTFEWSDGRTATGASAMDRSPTHEEREAMRQATGAGVAADAAYAKKVAQQSEKLRAEKDAEKEAKARRRQLSFKEKEKRKRDAGMQASAKNYVEEEKRRAREFGCYSGFDS